jgi:broad specificity phosphatase PhoE
MKPTRIFIIRHGESEGNIDKTIYSRKPDYALDLTPHGVTQAINAGKALKKYIRRNDGSEKFALYYSPFFRTIQTLNHCVSSLGVTNVDLNYVREDPRIREQEWHGALADANFSSSTTEHIRDKYGTFYYRFPHGGESCADVFDRMSGFITRLHHDFENVDFPENMVVFGHGMSMRVFMHVWYHKTVAEFETWENPHNCQIWVLEKNTNGKYDFDFTSIQKRTIQHNYSCALTI